MQLTISVDEKREKEFLRRAARSLSRDYRVPGFRPGKAPYSVVVRRMGVEAVRGKAIEQFGDQVFEQGLKESGLEPVDQASLEDVTWEPLTLHLQVPVGPEVSLGDFHSIRILWEEPQVTEQELNDELLRLQKQQVEWRPDKRPAELGDHVVVDITAKVGGADVLESKDREMALSTDSPYPVPGFAEAVVGMTPEETREFDLPYPEDHYNKDIAGKEGHFEVRLKEIEVEVLPLLDDEFAMMVGDYEGLDDLKTKLRQSLLEKAQEEAKRAYEEKIWEKLFEVASLDYPQAFVDRELQASKGRLEAQFQSQGIDMATYFQLTNTTEEAWETETRPLVEVRLKRSLLLAQIIEEEKLRAEGEEIEAEIGRIVEGMGERADEVRETLSSPASRMTILQDLLAQKATAYLKALARGEIAAEEEPVAVSEAAAPAEVEMAQEETAESEVVEQVPEQAEDVTTDLEMGSAEADSASAEDGASEVSEEMAQTEGETEVSAEAEAGLEEEALAGTETATESSTGATGAQEEPPETDSAVV